MTSLSVNKYNLCNHNTKHINFMGGKSHLHNIEGLIDHNISNKFVMDHKVLFLCVYFHDSRELN